MINPRYGVPVIIAAGLHGALFLIGSERRVVPPLPPTKITEVWLKPPVEDPVVMPPEERDHDTSPAGGPVKSLPSTPDVPAVTVLHASFTVPVEPYRPSLDPVRDLKDVPAFPTGSDILGGDPNSIGRPRLPGVESLDRAPRAVAQPSPNYPDGLNREGINGTVVVEFVVDLTGRVVKADAVRWSRREFVEPAVRAVLRWRFEPGTINGRKVSFRMAVPIEFNATQ